MDTKGAGVVAILLFLTVFAFFFTVPTLDHNSSVQHNEPTAGTIIQTDVEMRIDDGDREYRPVVVYEYTVDGVTYREENVYPGRFERWHSSQSTAERVVNQYVEGSATKASGEAVTVHYNPDRPSEAYLHNDGWPSAWYLAVGYVVVAVAGGGYFIRKGFRRWRQRHLIESTPTEQAHSLSIGPSEIKGRAVTDEGDELQAPFSEDECVVARYEIEEYDSSGDDSSWKTLERETRFTPFYVEDETGKVLVKPHQDAMFDLDPDDWTVEYVDSSERGPQSIREFVHRHPEIDFPSDASGKHNDRKYRQNLIRTGESVYVFGTVQQRDGEVDPGASNEERLVIQKVEDDSMREPLFLISDDKECALIERRKWALWRLPVGGLFLVAALVTFLFVFGPLLGVEMPRVFDGLVSDVS